MDRHRGGGDLAARGPGVAHFGAARALHWPRAMWRCVLILSLVSGCFYSYGGVGRDQTGYTNYPKTVEEDHAQRSSRRKHALIAAPLEMLAGVGITALALYAPIHDAHDADASISDALGDGAKEIGGRLLLASLGGALAVSGVGDGLLGVTHGLWPSPLVRDGVLVPADQIDTVAPLRAPRLNFHATQLISTRGVGSDGGLGLAHWITDTVRVRESAAVGWGLGFRARDRELRTTVEGAVSVERAFGRTHLGLLPRRAFGGYGSAGFSWSQLGDAPIVKGGLSATFGGTELRLGASYLPGVERLPAIELGLRRDFVAD